MSAPRAWRDWVAPVVAPALVVGLVAWLAGVLSAMGLIAWTAVSWLHAPTAGYLAEQSVGAVGYEGVAVQDSSWCGTHRV